MAYVFDVYLDKLASGLADMESLTLKALLTENATVFTPSKSLSTVAAVLAVAPELTATGYARQTLTTVSNDAGTNKRVITADAVEFAITQAGQNVAGLMVFAYDTDDATSWPISWHPEVVGTTTGADVIWVPTAGFVEVRGV